MKVQCSIFLGILCTLILPDLTTTQTKISLTEEKGNGKQEGKKQVPTFVGSDGVVRKVSPAAILEEMKRCLPPGLPIPIATAWPELPPHLEDLQEAEGNQNFKDPEEEQKIFQEKKRVSRSNDKNAGEIGIDAANDQSMNVKLEGPTKETSIFSPKGLNQNKMAEVLKDMLSRQMRRQNLTAEYIDDFNVRPRLNKAKQLDEYEDYDYTDPEEPKRAPIRTNVNQGGRRSTNSFQAKQQQRSKRRNKWKNRQQNTAERRRMNRMRKKPDYDYDDEESSEDLENHQHHKQLKPSKNHPQSETHIQSDELEKQIELNDFLEKNLHSNDGIPQRMVNIDKFIKRSGHFKMRLGENMDVLEGYQKMLAVIMKLNTTLIRLLDKFSTIFQKSLPKNHMESTGQQNEDGGKSSVIWDFMDLLMQQRRGARNKRENCRYLPENGHAEGSRDQISLEGTPTVVVSSSSSRTNMDLLKWLLKWYLTSTSK